MDVLPILRSLGGLGCVLGLLAGALWLVRRYDIALPGRTGALRDRRVSVVERVALDQRRAVLLVRRDDREHLFVLTPDGLHVLEGDIPAPPPAAPEPGGEASPPSSPSSSSPSSSPVRPASSLSGSWPVFSRPILLPVALVPGRRPGPRA